MLGNHESRGGLAISGCLIFGLAVTALLARPLTPSPGAPPTNLPLDGFRAGLAGRGLTFGVAYIGELFTNTAGGLHLRSDYADTVSLTLTFDLAKIIGWRGATLYAHGLGIHGRNPSLDVGDAQGVSNIGAYPASRLYEAWFQQNLFRDRLSLLAGVYDLNSEFAVLEAAGVFLNSSQAVDAVFAKGGLNGPSIFPYTALGLRFRFSPNNRFYLLSAVLDGVPGDPSHPGGTHILLRNSDGALLAAEAGWIFWSRGAAPIRLHRQHHLRVYEKPAHSGKVALGVWTYTAKFAPILQVPGEPPRPRVNGYHGLYFLWSQVLLADNENPSRHLAAFIRLGASNPKVSRFGLYTGAGLVFNGPFPGRIGDAAGLAFACARNGDDYIRSRTLAGAAVSRAEWDVELTYQARFAGWLAVQPDIQYVVHPGTNPAVKNALGFDIRVNVYL